MIGRSQCAATGQKSAQRGPNHPVRMVQVEPTRRPCRRDFSARRHRAAPRASFTLRTQLRNDSRFFPFVTCRTAYLDYDKDSSRCDFPRKSLQIPLASADPVILILVQNRAGKECPLGQAPGEWLSATSDDPPLLPGFSPEF